MRYHSYAVVRRLVIGRRQKGVDKWPAFVHTTRCKLPLIVDIVRLYSDAEKSSRCSHPAAFLHANYSSLHYVYRLLALLSTVAAQDKKRV